MMKKNEKKTGISEGEANSCPTENIDNTATTTKSIVNQGDGLYRKIGISNLLLNVRDGANLLLILLQLPQKE
jgi:hypothetical protein